MQIRSIAAAAFLSIACVACVEGSDSDRVDEVPVDPDKANDPETIVAERDNSTFTAEPSMCQIAPDPDEPEGPCTYACEPDRLQDFIAQDTCMTFLCYKWDGKPAKIGGCKD